MPLTAAQLNAYAIDAGIVSADQSKLATDQATETTDASTIAAGLVPPGQAVLAPDGLSVNVFTIIPANPGFQVTNYPLTT